MDDWSESDVQELLDNAATPTSGRMSQDLFSGKLSQSLDFEDLTSPNSITSSNSKAAANKASVPTSHDDFTGGMADADFFGSGANTDWLCTPNSFRRSGRSQSQKGKKQGVSGGDRESVLWSQDFPEDLVNSNPHQSLDTMSSDKTQHQPGLPNFSFLQNNSADSAFDSPAPTEIAVSLKKSGSTSKRLGSRFSYPKGKSAASVASSDSQLVLDLDVIKPPPPDYKKRNSASQSRRASPRVSKRESSVSDASMVVDVSLFKPDLHLDSINDETMMTSLNTASDATHFEVDQRASGSLKMGGDSQSLGSMDVSVRDRSLQTADRDDTVPASFDYASLELSPSFRALAEELDDPKERPSETQLLQIEKELDQLADDLPGMSGWSSMPDIPTQRSRQDKGHSSPHEAAEIVEETGGVVYGTLEDSPSTNCNTDLSGHATSMLRRSPRVSGKSSNTNSAKTGSTCKTRISRYVVPELSDDELATPLSTSRKSTPSRKGSKVQSTPPPAAKPVQFSLSNRKAARPRSPGNTETSTCTSTSDSQTGPSSSSLASSATELRNSSRKRVVEAKNLKPPKSASRKLLDASIDLTASDEDELAGVMKRRVVSPDVDLTKSDSECGSCSLVEDVPSGSEECSSVVLQNHSGMSSAQVTSPISATKKAARKRRVIESDDGSEIEEVSEMNSETDDVRVEEPAVPSTELRKSASDKKGNARSTSSSVKTPVKKTVGRQPVVTPTSEGRAKKKRNRIKSLTDAELDGVEQVVDSSRVNQRVASPSPAKTPTRKSWSHGRDQVKKQNQDASGRSVGKTSSHSTPSATKSSIDSPKSAKKLNKTKTECRHSSSKVVSPNKSAAKRSASGSKKRADKVEKTTDQNLETLNSSVSNISSQADSPRRSRRISQKNLSKELAATALDSPATPTNKHQELTKLVDSILESPLKELTTNVPVKPKDKSKRKHSQFSHERLVIEDVTLPETKSNSAEQVRSLLEFLEDTASALPLPPATSQPSLVCNVNKDPIHTEVQSKDGTSLTSPPSKRKRNKNRSVEMNARNVVQSTDSSCVEKPASVNKSKRGNTRLRRRLVKEESAAKVESEGIAALNRMTKGDENVANAGSNKESMLNRSSFLELMGESPVTRSSSKKRKSARKQPVETSDGTDSQLNGNVRSVIEDLESMLDTSLVGEPTVSLAPGDQTVAPADDATKQMEAVTMPAKSSEVSELSNSTKKNKPSTKRNTPKTRRKPLKSTIDTDECTESVVKAGVESNHANLTTNKQAAMSDHKLLSPKSRQLQRNEPIWLAKYSVTRDRSEVNDAKADDAPTKAEAICNLFTKNYGGRRHSKDSPASSSKVNTSSGSVSSTKPADLSVFDFIPSQSSPVKKKKKTQRRKQPAKSAVEKQPMSFKTSPKPPKVELLQKQALLRQANKDWGIRSRCLENNGDAGSDSEPPMSQATALRNHINEIDENVELTIEKPLPKKRCRFETPNSKKFRENKDKKNVEGADCHRPSTSNTTALRPKDEQVNHHDQSMSSHGESTSDSKSPRHANHQKELVNENTSVVGVSSNTEASASYSHDDSATMSSIANAPIPTREIKTELGPDDTSPSTVMVKTKAVKSKPDFRLATKRMTKPMSDDVGGQSELSSAKNNEAAQHPLADGQNTTVKNKRTRSQCQSPSRTPSASDSKPFQAESKKSTRACTNAVGLVQSDIRQYASPNNATDVQPLSGMDSQQTDQTLSPIVKRKRRSAARSVLDDTCSQVSESSRRAGCTSMDSSDALHESLSPVLRSRRRIKEAVVSSDSDMSLVTSTSPAVGSQLSKQSRKANSSKKSGKRIDADNSPKEKPPGPTIKEFGRPTRNTQVGEKLVFTHTALSSAQKKISENCAKILDAEIVPQYTSEVTHLITSIDANLCCPRTMKYMLAVLEGKWVVSCEWAKFCLEQSSRISEDIFEVRGSSVAPDSSASNRSRLARLEGLPRLLDGCEFYLSGEFTPPSPPKDQLSKLIQTAGAKVLSRHPREGSDVGAYHAPEGSVLSKCATIVLAVNVNNIKRMSTISYATPTWLIDCIAHYRLSDPKRRS